MANVQITQLPAALPLDGTELVPIVQGGVTVRTTTSAVAGSPSQTQTFLTVNQEPTLPNSRYLSASPGLSITDGGALSTLNLALTGTAASLNTATQGVIVKTAGGNVVSREIDASGPGISVSNGDGQTGNPTVSLDGLAASIANQTGNGLIALNSTFYSPVSIVGTADQVTVTNGDGAVGNPTIGIASNPILPGTGSVTIPKGTSAEQPVGSAGMLRYNTTTGTFDGYSGGAWRQFSTAGGVTTFSAGSTGFSPSSPTSGAVVLSGTLNVANGGTGANSLTGYVKGSGTSAMTASSTVPTTDLSGTVTNAQLANSSLTVNGTLISLGGSGTISAIASNPLTIGTGLTGGSYNGSSAVTVAIDSTVATLSGVQTLTNKSISGSTNTLTNVPNSALTNSSVTIGSTSVSLGGTASTLAGLTSVTLTQDPTADLQAATKQYVDNVAAGINFHNACYYATTADLGSVTYNNGASGVGATLTNAGTQAALVIDGHTFTATDATNAVRILVKNESNAAYNGIYTLTNQGSVSTNWVLTRATDYDSSGTGTNKIDAGDLVLILYGTSNANTSWVQQTPLPITVGTTSIVWVQFAAPTSYVAGTGLTLAGNTFSITNTSVSAATYGSASSVPQIAVNAQGQITSASNTSIAIDGNQITSGTVGSAYISGSYTGITGVGTLTAGTWNASTIGVGYGGTGLTSYSVGDITYASGTATLSKLALGTSGYVLTAGPAAPQYVAQSTLSVGSATTATNIAAGSASQIPYQTGAGATSFITAPGVSNTYLKWNGSSFIWAAAGTGTVTSVDVSGGTTGLTFSGGPVTTSGTITAAGTLVVSNGGTGAATLTGYVKGNGTSAMTASSTIPNTDITGLGTMSTQAASSVAITGGAIDGTTVGATTASTVRGTTITATTQFSGPGTGLTGTASGLSIGGSAASATTATTATNVAGGAAGSLVYQTGSGATTTLALGTTNYVLTAGASAPQYVAQSTLSVGSATTATNATNTAITANSTNSDYYITVVSANTGNLPQLVATGLTANPSTGKITGGIAGGTF